MIITNKILFFLAGIALALVLSSCLLNAKTEIFTISLGNRTEHEIKSSRVFFRDKILKIGFVPPGTGGKGYGIFTKPPLPEKIILEWSYDYFRNTIESDLFRWEIPIKESFRNAGANEMLIEILSECRCRVSFNYKALPKSKKLGEYEINICENK